jgi:plasmid maintenance system antidote protein VapI
MATFLDYDFVSPLPHPGEILREDFMAQHGLSKAVVAHRSDYQAIALVEA